ncbi:MAG TPA: DUF4251 domain-containing protein [Chitinophagaceae bacterium]|nr:DUF4251 domain-containing protein [Chitinophagaceae bacterium]
MKYFMAIALLLSVTAITQAQEKDAAATEQLVESKNYVFKAESVNPPRGRFRQLTSEYDLVVTGDTVIAYLPYFGRAYTAPINPSEGGIKFTSSDFEYKVEKKKKRSWEVFIRPKDSRDVQELYLTIFDNSRATLRVNSVNRESISFNGYIAEGKEKGKKAF